jgi:hypothetical protein
MGGGASPLNTGGGMGGQNQTFGTMGGFGGNLGTAGTMGNFFQQQQPQQQMQPQPSGNVGEFMQQNQQQPNTPNPGYQGGQTPAIPAGQDPTLIFNPSRPQQPDMSTAIGQLKGGDQFAAQNTMRQLVGLPPLQAPAYNANPTMSDVQKLLQSGDKASAQDMMQRMVGLPTSRPAPAIQAPPQQQPSGIQSLMQARPPRRRFGRR